MNFYTKFFVVFVLLAGSYIYSSYQKNIVESIKDSDIILKDIPSFKAKRFDLKGYVDNSIVVQSENTYFHFWGTWCAPCELEMPAFFNFAKLSAQENSTFVLFAVKDDVKKIKKFFKKIKIPTKNVIVVLDNDGSIMSSFGTTKVPETYLVDSKGNIVRKFIGPQKW